MHKINPFVLLLTILLACNNKHPQEHMQKIIYPVTKKVDTVDTYFGTKVPDPYRWLENDNSSQTAE